MKTLLVEFKTVYGTQKIYPACETSKKFAQLTGNKTLTEENIQIIKDLGYKFDVLRPQI